jgi:ankyrin repeat protein
MRDPLILAKSFINQGDLFALQSLVEKRRDLLKAVDNNEQSLLHLAVQQEKYNICAFLLKEGSLVDSRDNWGQTPFLLCRSDDIRFVTLLVSYGADVNAVDDDNRSLLWVHFCEECTVFDECLLEHGADVNIRTAAGTSCLFLSIFAGYVKFFWLFIKHGALIENDARVKHIVKKLGYTYFRSKLWSLRVTIALCSSKLDKNKISSLRLLSIDQIRELCSFLL